MSKFGGRRIAHAQANPGLLYDLGLGVPQGYAEAVPWYRKAAEHGDELGQSLLGRMYEKGQGVQENLALAHMWFNPSHSQATPGVSNDGERVARMMTPAQIAEAQRLAREWKPKKDR